MRELAPYASDFDKWIYSLLEMLRTKYFDVEVLRGKEKYLFKYKIRISKSISFRRICYMHVSYTINIIKIKEIKKTTLDEHFQNKTTPKQILDLIK